jgi:hypothetical protein
MYQDFWGSFCRTVGGHNSEIDFFGPNVQSQAYV